MTELPDPLTPPEADLQDFPFMPLQVARLRDSDLAAEEHPEACWYAVLLWAASWHQLPAGSLPDNDAVLMRLVGLGRDARTWKRHRAGALRGFVLCSDGRLYHPVVAEQVREAWDAKMRQRHRTFCATIRKHNERNPEDRRHSPSFEQWIEAACPQSVSDYVTPMSRVTDADVTRETPSKGQGQGQGQGQGYIEEDGGDAHAPERDPPSPTELIELTAEACRCAGVRHIDPGPILRHQQLVRGWLNEGFDPQSVILPAIRTAVAEATERIGSLGYFDRPIRQFHARKEAQAHGHSPRSTVQQPGNPMVRAVGARRARQAAAQGDDGCLRLPAGDR